MATKTAAKKPAAKKPVTAEAQIAKAGWEIVHTDDTITTVRKRMSGDYLFEQSADTPAKALEMVEAWEAHEVGRA